MQKFAIAAALIASLTLSCAARAEEFPARPVRVIVPLAAAGPADAIARLFAKHASDIWKQPVLIENRPGAAGLIGTQVVVRSRPDGYTLLFGVPSLTVFKVLIKDPPVDTARDLTPISQILSGPYGVAVPGSLPVNTLAEFIAYAKARPGQLNYASIAGGQTLAVELFRNVTGINLVRIAYAAAPSMIALGNGDVHLGFDSLFTLSPHVASGKVKVLAVTTAVRAPGWPNTPTVAEAGIPGYDVGFWFGILGPAGMARELQAKIAQEVAAFVKTPDTAALFGRFGYIPVGSAPEPFARYLADEIKLWSDVSRYANVTPQ